MKKALLSFCLLMVLSATHAADTLSIKQITGGTFTPETMRSLSPLSDGESFAQVSAGHDKILRYAFSTGEQTGVIFDVADTKGSTISDIDSYTPSPDGKRLLVATTTKRIYRRSYTAEHYVYDVESHLLTPLSKGGPQQTPIWSPDGRRIAFVRDNNIFVVDVDNAMRERQVTSDGRRNEIINGIPDWVNEEEFGFNCAMAFTANASHICWIRYDERRVATYALQLFKGLAPERQEFADYPGEYAYKYPKAGKDNAIVTAWSHDIDSGSSKAFELPLPDEGYIPRILPGTGKGDVVVYTLNRHQDSLAVYSADAATAQCRLLVRESVPKYVREDVLGGIAFTGKHILMPSDRNGTNQVYLYDLNGKLLRCLTSARYGVTNIYGYDERSQKLYFQAAGRSPMEREVYVADKKGKTTLLTPRPGWNNALFSADYRYYIRTWSDADTPYEVEVFDIKGKSLRTVVDNAELKAKRSALALTKKEFFSFTTSEGVELNGWMLKPIDFDPSKRYPVIMFQYSGPASQQVVNSYAIGSMGQGGMFDHYLAQQGFIVVCTDGRGTGGRGSEFEKCTYMQLGELEARDQVETALHLASLPYVDPQHIGIWGWSYGGFCTLMSMSEGRPVFAAGVAVAPPTNWRFYDTIYTARFMRTPQENEKGYAVNPTVRARQLHGALLICHGMADDNVHPQNSFEYSEALVQADKDFRELIYTNRNHSIYGANTRNHLLRQITNHFIDYLK